MKILKNVFWMHRKFFKIAISRDILLLTIVFLDIQAIKYSGRLLDAIGEYITNTDRSFRGLIYSDMFYIILITLLIIIINIVLNSIRDWLWILITKKYWQYFRYSIYNKLNSENLEDIENSRFQDLLALTQMYSENALLNIYSSISGVIRSLIQFISTIFVLQSFEFPIFLYFVVIFVACLTPLVSFYYSKKEQAFQKKNVDNIKYVNYFGQLILDIQNFIELKVNDALKSISNRFLSYTKDFIRGEMEITTHRRIDESFTNILGQLSVYTIFVYIIFFTPVGAITIGTAKMTVDYIQLLYLSFSSLVSNLSSIAANYSFSEYYRNYIGYKGFADNYRGVLEIKGNVKSISVHNIDYQYLGTSRKVLENINLDVIIGEPLLIIGEDNSGKSTLAKVLASLYHIVIGEYYINDYSVKELKRGEFKSLVSYMPQDFNRYLMSIKEGIIIGNDDFDSRKFERVVRIVGLDKAIEEANLNWDSIIGKNFDGGVDVSPSIAQRIALARMLYADRAILILDEPFAFIDYKSKREIMKKIIDNSKGRILIVITQSEELKDLFLNIRYLRRGKLFDI